MTDQEKFCVECSFYKGNVLISDADALMVNCHHPKSIDFAKSMVSEKKTTTSTTYLVNGRTNIRQYTRCIVMRNNEALCGAKAKLYKKAINI